MTNVIAIANQKGGADRKQHCAQRRDWRNNRFRLDEVDWDLSPGYRGNFASEVPLGTLGTSGASGRKESYLGSDSMVLICSL